MADNIAFGAGGATRSRAQVEDAARKAYAHDFCCELPHGYDTVLTGGAAQSLSGGQRQRLAIARAVLADPDILVLDEPTSALDAASEQLVHTALDELMRSRTTLVIAHRFTGLRSVDQIAVLDRGRLVELGKFPELAARPGGAFAALLRAQGG